MRKIIARQTLAVSTALCCAVLLMPAPARAQTPTTFTYYLQIPGILGDGGAVKGGAPAGSIEVLSFGFGDSSSILLSSTGVWKTGNTKFTDLKIQAVAGRASPSLFFSVAAGTQFPSVTLTGVGDMLDGRRVTVIYTLRNVFITGYEAANGSREVPTDSVGFTYGALSYDYNAYNPLTGLTVRTTTCFNMETRTGSATSGGC